MNSKPCESRSGQGRQKGLSEMLGQWEEFGMGGPPTPGVIDKSFGPPENNPALPELKNKAAQSAFTKWLLHLGKSIMPVIGVLILELGHNRRDAETGESGIK